MELWFTMENYGTMELWFTMEKLWYYGKNYDTLYYGLNYGTMGENGYHNIPRTMELDYYGKKHGRLPKTKNFYLKWKKLW